MEGEQCGNGFLQTDLGEACDDGDKDNGDGCSSTCMIENTHTCKLDAQLLSSNCTLKCGDGLLSFVDGEICDDHNNKDGDGCSGDCKVREKGFNCQLYGVNLTSICEPEP